MFLDMQDFDFVQILTKFRVNLLKSSKFSQILPKHAQIYPNFIQIFPNFSQICPNSAKKSARWCGTALPVPTAVNSLGKDKICFGKKY